MWRHRQGHGGQAVSKSPSILERLEEQSSNWDISSLEQMDDGERDKIFAIRDAMRDAAEEIRRLERHRSSMIERLMQADMDASKANRRASTVESELEVAQARLAQGLGAVAFEHALSLVCQPQRTREGALSWAQPSDEQMRSVRAWVGFVTAKCVPEAAEEVASQPTAKSARATAMAVIARGMYQAYAAELGWRRPFDNGCLRRWSVHDVIAEGEPLVFGGAKAYAMDDGSSAGKTERNAWCRLIFEVRESIGRRTMEEWAMLLYVVYADYLGGVSTYAPHEPLAPWGDLHDLERRGWLRAALYATDHIGCSCHP